MEPLPLYLTLPYDLVSCYFMFVFLFMIRQIPHEDDGDLLFWELAK